MVKKITLLLFGVLLMNSFAQDKNPFFVEWTTPYQTPPFDLIKVEHFKPAYLEGMKQQMEEIDAIVNNTEAPTFENTIVALDKSGELLSKVASVFGNLNSANTSKEIQDIARELSPLLSKHGDDIDLNPKLFAKVKAVYAQKDKLKLNAEQKILLEKYYKDFVRSGAELAEKKQERLRKVNEELSMLSLNFGQNILKEDNNFQLVIDKEEDLAGLPEGIKQGAADDAKRLGHEGKWVFTLHKPSLLPFLQFADKREYREKMFKGYINRGNNNDEFDNKVILSKMAALRVERANLLGYKTHADFVLETSMAKSPDKVYTFLNQIWEPALKMAKKEAADLQEMIKKDGKDFKLEPWDWSYYAEKVKKEKYALDDELLRPYFKLENVIDGVFYVANKLYGIKVEERKDIPVYHPDVRVFEVKEADGTHIGIFFTDYFPRPSKRGGAWSSSFRSQSKVYGKKITPVVTNVCSFSKPTGDLPALLTFDEVATLFHEFGHALHSLFNDVNYNRLRGTPRDFVELPSQVMENWAADPEVLKVYAKHYKTGEVIPQELVDKFMKAGTFNEGFNVVEYIAASLLDMDWHTLTEPKEQNTLEFENNSMAKMNLMPEIVSRYRSTYFSHIFSGGYSSGYYSYLWAQVLDSDAFAAFKESGNIFNQDLAKKFRTLLSKGGSDEGMKLYVQFRGAEPKVDALLKKRGLK